MTKCDVAVLGAGAAGMMAALRAAERGRSVTLLEKNKRPGIKILMSGGTRCNVTNARGLRRAEARALSGPIDPAYNLDQGKGARSIQEAFGPNGAFLAPALKAFSAGDTVRFFEAEGVALKIEANGKIFPVSNRAVDVLAALVGRLKRSGARLELSCPARAIEPLPLSRGGGFRIETPHGTLEARTLVLATGGLSYPGCGTTGDGYGFAQRVGHTLVEPKPALVPLKVAASWVPELRGIAVPDAEATALPDAEVATPTTTTATATATGRQTATATATALACARREAVLFAHFGLSGPAILDVSSAVARLDDPTRCRLRLDFLPDLSSEALDKTLQTESRLGRRLVETLLPAHLPHRLVQALLLHAGLPADRKGPDLSREERKRLVRTLKTLDLPITGTLGFEKAEVTSGGVALEEVDPHTGRSLLHPDLRLVGEVLDLDGRIGGYNFQAAWSGGWLVGSTV